MRVDGEWRRILNKVRVLAAALLITLMAALFSVETAPVTGEGKLTVVVDPGHGGEDGGAVSADGIQEAGLNLDVAKLVKAELEGLGFEVILTREDENALASTKKADMAARRSIMNQAGVDCVVSVHMNKFTDCAVHGPMAFYMEGSAEGEKLAKAVIDSITGAIGAPTRLANPGDYYVIRESEPVAVLVECGFLSNSNDVKLLTDPIHQKTLAKAIAVGVHSYFSGVNVLD